MLEIHVSMLNRPICFVYTRHHFLKDSYDMRLTGKRIAFLNVAQVPINLTTYTPL